MFTRRHLSLLEWWLSAGRFFFGKFVKRFSYKIRYNAIKVINWVFRRNVQFRTTGFKSFHKAWQHLDYDRELESPYSFLVIILARTLKRESGRNVFRKILISKRNTPPPFGVSRRIVVSNLISNYKHSLWYILLNYSFIIPPKWEIINRVNASDIISLSILRGSVGMSNEEAWQIFWHESWLAWRI